MFRWFKKQERKPTQIVQQIPNREISLEHVPPSDSDWSTIAAFALTYDGFTASGSFERCAEIANDHRHDTLSDLRTCLFFEQRRWRHYGRPPEGDDLAYIRNLVESIRGKIAAGCLE